jgi:PAS domain S-box-containing protein
MAFELFDAHQEAKRKQLLLERAERIAHLGSWELNLHTGATYWSNEFFRICGLEPGAFEPSAERGIALIHPDDRDRAAQAVNLSVETGEPYDIVKRIVRPDGSVRTVQSVGEISYDQEGKPAKLSGSFLDITDLLATEGKYQTLFEASPVAMSEEDFSQVKAAIDGLPIAARENPRTFFADKPDLVRELAGLVRVVDVNRAAVRLYNASDKQQLLGTITKTYGEDSFDGLVEALVAIAEGRRALSVRTRHYTFDGKPLDLRLTWSVPEQHADTYSRVLVAASDISEISRECKKNSAAASAYSNTRLHP